MKEGKYYILLVLFYEKTSLSHTQVGAQQRRCSVMMIFWRAGHRLIFIFIFILFYFSDMVLTWNIIFTKLLIILWYFSSLPSVHVVKWKAFCMQIRQCKARWWHIGENWVFGMEIRLEKNQKPDSFFAKSLNC